MSKQQIIPEDLRQRYELAIGTVEASAEGAAEARAAYWWNLYVIWRDDLWRADCDGFREWLGWFAVQSWGESAQTFYNVKGAVERWFGLGFTEEQVKNLLRSRKVALEHDIKEWFLEGGKGDLRPEIKEKLDAEGETIQEAVLRIADLGPGEARKEVRRFVDPNHIFAHKMSTYWDPKTHHVLVNVQWENEEDGIVGVWTIKLTGEDVTEGKHPADKKKLPEKVARWLVAKLGAEW